MSYSLYNNAVRLSLIAFAASGIAIAQEAPSKESADKSPAAPVADPAATKSDSSFALGYRTGANFAQEFGRYGVKHDDLEMESFFKGLELAVKGEKPSLDEARLQGAMASFGEMLQAREKSIAEVNAEAGKKFLEENGKREGVTSLESGLQYEVISKGGETKYVAPKEGEPQKQFMVNYKGSLIDGVVFDESPEGTPVSMTLEVVDGFKEALTLMPVGAKWKLFIPSKLAYGEERRSLQIAPNSTLIFELELVEIKDVAAAPTGGGFPLPIPAGE